MRKKIICFWLLSILLLPFFAFANDFGKYTNTNQLIWDKNFKNFVKNYFGEIEYKYELNHVSEKALLADYIIETLKGTPDNIIQIEKNVIFASACLAYYCPVKGAVVLDINTNEALFGVIEEGITYEGIVADKNIDEIIQGNVKDRMTLLIAYKDDDFHNKYQDLFFDWVKDKRVTLDEVNYIKIKRNTKAPVINTIETVEGKIPETFYGKWKVVEFREYAGHALITKHEVKYNLEKVIELNENNVMLEEKFLFRQGKCENPSYDFYRHGLVEGNIFKTSQDFNFMLEREYTDIVTLTCDDFHFMSFELIGENRLLVLWDGYFVLLDKIGE